jgi:hypothetical protein
MIHVATAHHKSDKWIDVQLDYLARHLQEPYRVVASFQGIDPVHEHKFGRVVPAVGGHAGKLNLLASLIVEEAEHDDLIMFLDGDAFPIADPMPTVHKALDDSILVAVRRDEVAGDKQPHPCFCVIRAEDWDRIRGDWSPGHPWKNEQGELLSDAGGNLLGKLERMNASWTPLLRSNKKNPHPLWFAIYGDVLYHHGAGFRDAVLPSALTKPPKWLDGTERFRLLGSIIRHADAARVRALNYRGMKASNRLGDEVYARLQTDPSFYEEFL